MLTCLTSMAASYQLQSIAPNTLQVTAPTLPDISGYTPQTVEKKLLSLRQKKTGTVTRKLIKNLVEMRVPFSGKGFLLLAIKQNTLPAALVIENGVLSLDQISKSFPRQLVRLGKNEYLAKLPIVVSIHASLIIADQVLKLSEEKGAMLVNGGTLLLKGGALMGWRESTNGPAWYTGDKKSFRPYYVAWGGSQTFFSETKIAHLGYFGTKAYGVTLASYHIKSSEKVFQRHDFDFSKMPEGWFINSSFSDIYYGFYCYEAKNIAIINNIFKNNIVYGIDPHDRSQGLIIAKNLVFGTRKKHGIIMSREVNDSFIFANTVRDNKLSGIMLDRQCTDNQVAGNKLFNNGSGGITLYESSNNLIAKNSVYSNGAHGICLRNSEGITLQDNVIFNNRGYGVYLHIQDLLALGHKRNLKQDPYLQRVSGMLRGGVISQNSSGSIFLKSPQRFTLYNVLIDQNGGSSDNLKFGGDLTKYHNGVVKILWGEKKAAALVRQGEP